MPVHLGMKSPQTAPNCLDTKPDYTLSISSLILTAGCHSPWCPGRLCLGCTPCAVPSCPVWSTEPGPSRIWPQPSARCRSHCTPEDPAPAACRGCWRPAECLYRWTSVQSSQRAGWPAPCAHPPSHPSAPMVNSVQCPFLFWFLVLSTPFTLGEVCPMRPVCSAGSDKNNNK